MKAMSRDFLTLQDYSPAEILDLVKLSSKFKKGDVGSSARRALEGKHLSLLFQKPSTRTRVSFEVAIKRLGGTCTFLSTGETQISRGETVADTARVLSRYVDAIVARVYRHSFLVEMAKYSDVPVVNALSDLYHPAQILSDLLTISEAKGRLKGLKLAYVGDGNNVCNSLLVGCSKTGIDISVACPKGYDPDRNVLKRSRFYASASQCSATVTRDPVEACRDVDVIYTDTFVSMGAEKERARRLRAFLPKYRVTPKLFDVAAGDAIFLHCLPAHRGEEVTSDVIDGPRSLVWTQAENRLYGQEAILASLLG